MSSPARVVVFSVVVLVFLFVSCARGEEPAGAEAPTVRSQSADLSSMDLTEEGRARASSDESSADDAPTQPVLDPTDVAFAAQRMRAVPINPVDFYIGEIGSPATGRARSAWTVAKEVLLLVVDTDVVISHSALSPADRRALVEVAGEGPFEELRLARPVILSGQSYSMMFRLQDGDNVIIGEIVVDGQNEEWYTAGIQARPAREMRMQYAPNAEVPGLVW